MRRTRLAMLAAAGVAVALTPAVARAQPAAPGAHAAIILQKNQKQLNGLLNFTHALVQAFGDVPAPGLAPIPSVDGPVRKGRKPNLAALRQRLKLIVLRPFLEANFVPIGRFPIHTTDIADGAVTGPKLAPNSVTGDKVAPNSLTIRDIGDITEVQQPIDIPAVQGLHCAFQQYSAGAAHAGQTPVIGITGDEGLPAGLIAEALKVPADGTVNVRFCNSTNTDTTAAAGVTVRFVFFG